MKVSAYLIFCGKQKTRDLLLMITVVLKYILEAVKKLFPEISVKTVLILYYGTEAVVIRKIRRILKEHNFHIMLFSWRSVEWFRKELNNDDINNFNIIVTDPYVEEERIYNVNRDDGIHNVIGSGNQRIWLPKENKIYYARDIRMMTLSKNKKLEVIKYNG